KIENLLIYDIENHLCGHGISVVGDSFARFSKGRSSHNLCVDKIKKHLESTGFTVSKERSDQIKSNLSIAKLTYIDSIRGHFIFSAAMYFISNTVKRLRNKTSIPKDSLYGSIILAFE